MADFTYEIIQELGILSESKSSWRRELNLVSWNGKEPKYDIRDWAPGHEKMGKGISLTGDEIRKLKSLLNQIGD
ncbi:MAG: YdbC family protein [Bhargavaea sp.]